MKITIYELLGMVKNNKNLPKKIKYGNDVYVLQENPEDYATWLNDNLDLLNDVILGHFNIENAIYLELEIIEEEPRNIELCGSWFTKSEYDKLAQSEEEKKIPKKFKINYEIDEENTINMKEATMLECDLACRINEIIDYLDYLKSKGE